MTVCLPRYFSHCESFVAEQAVFRICNNVLKLVWINFLDAYPWTLFVFWRFSRYLRPIKKSSFASIIVLLKYNKHYSKTLKLFIFAKFRFIKRLRCKPTIFDTTVRRLEINLPFTPEFFSLASALGNRKSIVYWPFIWIVTKLTYWQQGNLNDA